MDNGINEIQIFKASQASKLNKVICWIPSELCANLCRKHSSLLIKECCIWTRVIVYNTKQTVPVKLGTILVFFNASWKKVDWPSVVKSMSKILNMPYLSYSFGSVAKYTASGQKIYIFAFVIGLSGGSDH